MTDNMKKFLEEASRDKAFLEKLQKTETPEAVIALAKEKGYALSTGDLKMPEHASGELADGELDAVSGGVQAGIITTGGVGEFGPVKPPEHEETEQERHWRLMRELVGKSYL